MFITVRSSFFEDVGNVGEKIGWVIDRFIFSVEAGIGAEINISSQGAVASKRNRKRSGRWCCIGGGKRLFLGVLARAAKSSDQGGYEKNNDNEGCCSTNEKGQVTAFFRVSMANVGAGSLARREHLVGMPFVDRRATCSTRRRGGSVAGNVPLVGALLASLRWLLPTALLSA